MILFSVEWSKWWCTTNFCFLPKIACLRCLFFFYVNVSLNYWLSRCTYAYIWSIWRKCNKLQLLPLPYLWSLVVLCTEGVSLSTVENDTILFRLTTRNWPTKHSFISLVRWIHYKDISNHFWTPFPFLSSILLTRAYTYCIILQRKKFLDLNQSIFTKTLKRDREDGAEITAYLKITSLVLQETNCTWLIIFKLLNYLEEQNFACYYINRIYQNKIITQTSNN